MKQRSGKVADYWREEIRLAAEHPKGVRDYCERNGIQRQAFYYWKKRLNGRGPLRRRSTAAFAKVEVVDSPLEVRRPAAQERLPDPKWLAEFLLALSAGGGQ